MDRTVTLASASPRRKDLIEQMGLPHRIMPVEVDESFTGLDPVADTLRLAELKLSAFLGLHNGPECSWVLAADTIVTIDSKKIGKPADRGEARRMLGLFAGRTHTVITGLAFFSRSRHGGSSSGNDGLLTTAHALTDVTFAPMTEEEIERYLDQEEWAGVAAGYRIQEKGSCFITELRGSYSNVMGLPIHTFYGILKKHKYPF